MTLQPLRRRYPHVQNLFLEQGCIPALHFFWRQGFQMTTEQPFMAERIAHGT